MRAEPDLAHGIVLAAGRSVRMGHAKPLLSVGAETLLERAVRVLREGGCARVSVVVNERADATVAAARAVADVVVVPDRPDAEPIDSLRAALRVLPADVRAAVVLPVDCVGVGAATVRQLLDRFKLGGSAAVVPVYAGTRGHPVLLGRDLFETVLTTALPHGLRSLLEARDDVALLGVADAGVTVDIDTPSDASEHGVVP